MTKTTPLGFSVAMLQKFAAKTRTISESFMYPAALLLVFRSPPPWVLPLFFRSPGQQWAMIASVGCQLPMRQISYSTQQETFWILQFLQCFCCHRRSPKCLNLHKITRKTTGPSRLALPMLTPTMSIIFDNCLFDRLEPTQLPCKIFWLLPLPARLAKQHWMRALIFSEASPQWNQRHRICESQLESTEALNYVLLPWE